MARKKKSTPAWVNKLLNFQETISPEEYAKLWRRINRASHNRRDEEAWNEEGQRIIAELEAEREQPIFRARDYQSVSGASRAAEIYRQDHGGRIVRRDGKGRFSKRGRTFQVIGGKK